MSLVDTYPDQIEKLKNAFERGDLSLYLGAGVSMPSGLPSWEQLVLMLYYDTLGADITFPLQPFPNYLMAIAEWMLGEKKESLDTIIRKIKRTWGNNFYDLLKQNLYLNFSENGMPVLPPGLLEANRTLESVVRLCAASVPGTSGVKSVITYNYDDLLEIGLKKINRNNDFSTVWASDTVLEEDRIPIYHVHGFIPFEGEGSGMDDMVFSEEQYNEAYQNAYFWGNMIQMQSMSNDTGLLVGISLADRNIRRLLDAIKRAPLLSENYLLIRKPKYTVPEPDSGDIKYINKRALEYLEIMAYSGIKKEHKAYDQITGIITQIYDFEKNYFNDIYSDFGLEVLWYDDHDEVHDFICKIFE